MLKINIFEKTKKSLVTISVLSVWMFGLLFTATAARADSISIILDSPFQSAMNGDTLTFFATVTDTDALGSAPIYLNGDAQTLASPLSLNDSGFSSNFPSLMTPGESIYGELFSVLVPVGTSTGSYAGIFVLQGGSDAAAQLTLGSAVFNVDATSTPMVTPEPSTLLLLATGLLSLAALPRIRAKNGWARQSVGQTAQDQMD